MTASAVTAARQSPRNVHDRVPVRRVLDQVGVVGLGELDDPRPAGQGREQARRARRADQRVAAGAEHQHLGPQPVGDGRGVVAVVHQPGHRKAREEVLGDRGQAVEGRDQDEPLDRAPHGDLDRHAAAEAAADDVHRSLGMAVGDQVDEGHRIVDQCPLGGSTLTGAVAPVGEQVAGVLGEPVLQLLAQPVHRLAVAAEVDESATAARVHLPAAQAGAADREVKARVVRREPGRPRGVDETSGEGGQQRCHGTHPRTLAACGRPPVRYRVAAHGRVVVSGS